MRLPNVDRQHARKIGGAGEQKHETQFWRKRLPKTASPARKQPREHRKTKDWSEVEHPCDKALEDLKLQCVVARHIEPPDYRPATIKRLHLRMMERNRPDFLPRKIHEPVG